MTKENQAERIRRTLQEEHEIVITKAQLDELSDDYSVTPKVIESIINVCEFWQKRTEIQLPELVSKKIVEFSRLGTAVISNVPENRSCITMGEPSDDMTTTIVKTDGSVLISDRFGSPLRPM